MNKLSFFREDRHYQCKNAKDHEEFFHDEIINRNSSYLPIPWKKKDQKPQQANHKNVGLVVLMNKLLYLEHFGEFLHRFFLFRWTLAVDGCPRFVLLFQLDHSL